MVARTGRRVVVGIIDAVATLLLVLLLLFLMFVVVVKALIACCCGLGYFYVYLRVFIHSWRFYEDYRYINYPRHMTVVPVFVCFRVASFFSVYSTFELFYTCAHIGISDY